MTFYLFTQPIDFLHERERGADNQASLDANRTHFNNQCQKVFDLLMDGNTLSSLTGVTVYGMMDTKRRIKDLRDKGIRISDRAIEKGHGAKEWYMSEQDIFHNKTNYR